MIVKEIPEKINPEFNADEKFSWPAVEWSLILLGLLMLLFILPHLISGDGRVRFEALEQLLESGNLVNMPYSMVGPIFSTPLYLMGKFVKTPEFWCARYNFIVLLMGLAGLYYFLKDKLHSSILRKFLILLIYGSMFSRHQVDYYGEIFTAMFVCCGIVALYSERRKTGWIFIVIGVMNTPAALLGLVLIAVFEIVSQKKLRYLIIPAIPLLFFMIDAWIRRGDPLLSGYEGRMGPQTVMPYSGLPGFSYPIFLGIVSILLSFGKGIVYFAPGILLPLRKGMSKLSSDLHSIYKLWIVFLIGLIIAYAKWRCWYGGFFWGPRFFLFASIPASLAIALYLTLQKRTEILTVLLILILTLSFWVGINGVIFDQRNLEICSDNRYEQEHLCWYVPEFSVLIRPFVIAKQLNIRDKTIIFMTFIAYSYLLLPLLAMIIPLYYKKMVKIRYEYLSWNKWRF